MQDSCLTLRCKNSCEMTATASAICELQVENTISPGLFTLHHKPHGMSQGQLWSPPSPSPNSCCGPHSSPGSRACGTRDLQNWWSGQVLSAKLILVNIEANLFSPTVPLRESQTLQKAFTTKKRTVAASKSCSATTHPSCSFIPH